MLLGNVVSADATMSMAKRHNAHLTAPVPGQARFLFVIFCVLVSGIVHGVCNPQAAKVITHAQEHLVAGTKPHERERNKGRCKKQKKAASWSSDMAPSTSSSGRYHGSSTCRSYPQWTQVGTRLESLASRER